MAPRNRQVNLRAKPLVIVYTLSILNRAEHARQDRHDDLDLMIDPERNRS